MDVCDPSVVVNKYTNKLVKVSFVMPDGTRKDASDIIEAAKKYLMNDDNEAQVLDKLFSLGEIVGAPIEFIMGYMTCLVANAMARGIDPNGVPNIDIHTEPLTRDIYQRWQSHRYEVSGNALLDLSKILRDKGGPHEDNPE